MSDTEDFFERIYSSTPDADSAAEGRSEARARRLAEENVSPSTFDFDSGASLGAASHFEPSQATLKIPPLTRLEELQARKKALELAKTESEIEELEAQLAASQLRLRRFGQADSRPAPALCLSDLAGPTATTHAADPAVASFLRESAIASQQRGNPSRKLRSMKTMEVFFFLVNQNHADLLPAWQHVDISVEGLRTLVAYVLGHTGVTLADVYGDEIGPDQRFLVDLHAYLRTRDDWEEQEILATFKMKPTAEVDLQAVTTLCSSLLMTTVKFAYFFSSSLQTVKDGLVSNLQPTKFRDYIRKKFRNEYKLETMSLERLCSLIVSEADKDVARASSLFAWGHCFDSERSCAPSSPSDYSTTGSHCRSSVTTAY